MSETKGVLLPAYVLADESGSMSPYLGELSNGLVSLCEGLRAEPMVAAKLRLAVLGFSDDVQVRLAVADMRTEGTLPQVTIRGLTNYKAVFEDLLHRNPADVQWLRGEGYKVHRPVVSLLSDGQPTDGGSWRGPHATPTDKDQPPTAPNIIVGGIGDARAEARTLKFPVWQVWVQGGRVYSPPSSTTPAPAQTTSSAERCARAAKLSISRIRDQPDSRPSPGRASYPWRPCRVDSNQPT